MGLGYEHRGSAMGFSGGETPPRAGPSHRLTTPSQNFAGRGPPGGDLAPPQRSPPRFKIFRGGERKFQEVFVTGRPPPPRGPFPRPICVLVRRG